MTDEPVASNPADDLEAAGSPAPEPTVEADAVADSADATELNEARPTPPKPADRAQQILTVAVLLLIAASAVLLAISIANQ